ncbi:hypothetical protein L195_g029093, partial [Trifolium pratense]
TEIVSLGENCTRKFMAPRAIPVVVNDLDWMQSAPMTVHAVSEIKTVRDQDRTVDI